MRGGQVIGQRGALLERNFKSESASASRERPASAKLHHSKSKGGTRYKVGAREYLLQ